MIRIKYIDIFWTYIDPFSTASYYDCDTCDT